VLEAAPAAFSFVFGVPDRGLLEAFGERGIVTIGTAITSRRPSRSTKRAST
jgi:hypothetical protein